jgi:hypothetical protein
MKPKVWIPLALLLFLGGCFNELHDPGATEDLQNIEVSATEVSVGDPVQVTLTLAYRVSVGSSFPSYEVGGVRMATCFNPKSGLGDDLCYKLPENIRLVGESETYRDVEKFELGRGEERKVEHTFTFTSTVPQVVELNATLVTINPKTLDQGTPIKSVEFK